MLFSSITKPKRIFPLILLLLCGCGEVRDGNVSETVQNISEITQNISEQAQETESAETAEISAIRNDGVLMFGFTADEFVNSFNAVYSDEYGEDYLTPVSQWNCYEACSPLVDNDGMAYCFTEDREILSMPNITLFTDDNGGVYEIMATFDDHGYQDWLNKKFGIISMNMIETVLPDMADTEAFYRELYALAGTNFYGDDYKFPPSDFYRSGDVGLYSYYGGGTINICAVPADDALENALSRADCVIHGIE